MSRSFLITGSVTIAISSVIVLPFFFIGHDPGFTHLEEFILISVLYTAGIALLLGIIYLFTRKKVLFKIAIVFAAFTIISVVLLFSGYLGHLNPWFTPLYNAWHQKYLRFSTPVVEDFSDCDKVGAGAGGPDFCKIGLATNIGRKSESIAPCEEIADDRYKQSCLFGFAETNKDAGVCNMITINEFVNSFDFSKEECLRRIQSTN